LQALFNLLKLLRGIARGSLLYAGGFFGGFIT